MSVGDPDHAAFLLPGRPGVGGGCKNLGDEGGVTPGGSATDDPEDVGGPRGGGGAGGAIRVSEEGLVDSLAGEISPEPLVSFTPFAFSNRRARLASRAFRSSSARRRASVAAVPPALVAVGAEEEGNVFPELEGAGCGALVPRLPRTRVQPSWSGSPTSPAPDGEVWVAALARAGAACCGVVGAVPPDSTELVTSLSPKDCKSVIS